MAVEEIQVTGPTIGLGQLLKFSGLAESGAHARELIADGDVRVDGTLEQRRGAQIGDGSLVEVALPDGTQSLRVRASTP